MVRLLMQTSVGVHLIDKNILLCLLLNKVFTWHIRISNVNTPFLCAWRWSRAAVRSSAAATSAAAAAAPAAAAAAAAIADAAASRPNCCCCCCCCS